MINENLSAQKYLKVMLEPKPKPSRHDVLQENQLHAMRLLVQMLFQDNHIHLLECLGNNADINPIEILWRRLKK